MRSLVCLFAASALSVPTISAAQSTQGDIAKPTIEVRFVHKRDNVSTTPFNNERGVPLFRAMIADEPVCALLDTGADESVVGLQVAQKKGLTISDPKGELIGLNASTPSYLITAVPITIPGQLSFTRDMIGAKLPDFVCPDGTKLGLVFGMDFLGKMAVYLDNVRQRMILVPSGFITPNVERFTRIAWHGGQVDGAIENVPTRIKVDTGSSAALTIRAREFARFYPAEKVAALPDSTTLAGSFSNEGVKGATFSIGALTIKGNAKRVPNITGSAPASIGYQVFGQTTVVLDASKGAIFVRKPEVVDE